MAHIVMEFIKEKLFLKCREHTNFRIFSNKSTRAVKLRNVNRDLDRDLRIVYKNHSKMSQPLETP